MGHTACLLCPDTEGEKAGWCRTATGDSWVFSLHSPLKKGGFLKEQEVKKTEKRVKEQECN